MSSNDTKLKTIENILSNKTRFIGDCSLQKQKSLLFNPEKSIVSEEDISFFPALFYIIDQLIMNIDKQKKVYNINSINFNVQFPNLL
jgi:hypothetical protein